MGSCPIPKLFSILAIFCFFILADCQALEPASSPKETTADNQKKKSKDAIQAQEARFFAAEYVKQKEKVGKPAVSKKTDPVWGSIRGKKLDSSRPLSLAELVDIAMSNNPTTRQSWYNLSAAVAQEKQAKSALYPSVTASGDITDEKTSATGLVSSTRFMHYGPSLKLNYLLFDFGGRSGSIEQAIEIAQAANFQYNQSIQDLLLAVERSYYQLYSAQAAEDAAELDVDTSRKDLDAAQKRFDAGLVPKLDVYQAQSDYSDSLYGLETAKSQNKSAKAVLAQTLGFPADTKFEIANPKEDVPEGILSESVSRLIEEAIVQRPDLSSARANYFAGKAAVKAATSNLWPTFSLGGSAGKDWYDYRADPDIKKHDFGYTGFLTVSWDIFDGFFNLNKKRQAQAEFDAAREGLTQAELQASADVWIKYYNFSSAVSKLKFSKSFYESANASYELALESYMAGTRSMLDLIQSQNQLSDARSKLIQSKQDIFIALAELTYATGSMTANNKGETK